MPSPPGQPPAPLAPSCDSVLDAEAGGYTCGERIEWLVNYGGSSIEEAQTTVAAEYPVECGACGGATSASLSPPPPPSSAPTAGAVSSACLEQAWETDAGGYTCGERITWLIDYGGSSVEEAQTTVAAEFPAECGACGDTSASAEAYGNRLDLESHSLSASLPETQFVIPERPTGPSPASSSPATPTLVVGSLFLVLCVIGIGCLCRRIKRLPSGPTPPPLVARSASQRSLLRSSSRISLRRSGSEPKLASEPTPRLVAALQAMDVPV